MTIAIYMSSFNSNTIIREVGVACHSSKEMQLVELARRGISKKSILELAKATGL